MPRYRRKRQNSNLPVTVILLAVIAFFVMRNNVSAETSRQIGAILLAVSALCIVSLIGFHYIKNRRRIQKMRALQMIDADMMDGLDFEKYVAELLKSRGFSKVRLTERYDLGVDIVAHKDGVCWGIQVKRYSNMVKAEAVRQVVTALKKYKCDRGMVITNSVFSRPAKVLAESNDCVLIGKDEIAGWIVGFQRGS